MARLLSAKYREQDCLVERRKIGFRVQGQRRSEAVGLEVHVLGMRVVRCTITDESRDDAGYVIETQISEQSPVVIDREIQGQF